mmetsp:Transcript_25340/g.28104  ORF Transcript_25340/g.28104 Transcript_25340/m.28104 type:complete len:219 (-) Transcript_25340:522-1178(-)
MPASPPQCSNARMGPGLASEGKPEAKPRVREEGIHAGGEVVLAEQLHSFAAENRLAPSRKHLQELGVIASGRRKAAPTRFERAGTRVSGRFRPRVVLVVNLIRTGRLEPLPRVFVVHSCHAILLCLVLSVRLRENVEERVRHLQGLEDVSLQVISQSLTGDHLHNAPEDIGTQAVRERCAGLSQQRHGGDEAGVLCQVDSCSSTPVGQTSFLPEACEV